MNNYSTDHYITTLVRSALNYSRKVFSERKFNEELKQAGKDPVTKRLFMAGIPIDKAKQLSETIKSQAKRTQFDAEYYIDLMLNQIESRSSPGTYQTEQIGTMHHDYK